MAPALQKAALPQALFAALALLTATADAFELQPVYYTDGRYYYYDGWSWWLWLVIFVPVFLITLGIILCCTMCCRRKEEEQVMVVQQQQTYPGGPVTYVQQPTVAAV